MELKTLSIIISIVFAISGGTWFIADTFATNDDLKLVVTKTDAALDLQLENLRDQLNKLKSKKNKDADDREQINYLRKQIERYRKMRSL